VGSTNLQTTALISFKVVCSVSSSSVHKHTCNDDKAKYSYTNHWLTSVAEWADVEDAWFTGQQRVNCCPVHYQHDDQTLYDGITNTLLITQPHTRI